MAAEKQSADSPIEYSIYLYELPNGKGRKNQWEKHSTTEDMDAALREAEKLFQSGQYKKVEVKKKYEEEKTGRKIDMTLRVFEAKEKRDYSLVLFILLAIVGGVGAFALTFLLGG
ncbi:MAG: hypothetical protein EOM26_00790 [Alphaproteobacteria bacterium]|nr:hypothetical protein [Alphaproteobacteria bacterium]